MSTLHVDEASVMSAWPRGKVVVVQLEERLLYGCGYPKPAPDSGAIVIYEAAEELGIADTCELRPDGLMVRGWPSGVSGYGNRPPQGMVLHATDSRAEAQKWLDDFRRW